MEKKPRIIQSVTIGLIFAIIIGAVFISDNTYFTEADNGHMPEEFISDSIVAKLAFEEITKKSVDLLISVQSIPKQTLESWIIANRISANKNILPAPKGEMSKYDLDDDGIEEVFLYLSGFGMCGRGGCKLIILQRDGRHNGLEYKTKLTASNDILILSKTTDGYHNIAIRTMDGIQMTISEQYTLFRWKGGVLNQTDKKFDF